MKHKQLATATVALIIVSAAVVTAWLVLMPKTLIPQDIRKQINVTILLPSSKGHYVVDKTSYKYEPSLKLLTFGATTRDNYLVVSEQPTPDSFVDIPEVYDKLVAGFGEYSKFDDDIGTIHLIKSTALNGQQAAVLNAKGTLLFAKPNHDLSDDQWRQFFNTLIIIK